MSQIGSEYAGVAAAFSKPTLRLLDKKWAPVILAIFNSTFSRDESSIPTERFHSQVGALLAELESLGHDIPEGFPRNLCRKWVREQWLIRDTNRDDEAVEEYTLTWHSQEALKYVQDLNKDRTSLSESRIVTILEAARRIALEANPNPEERIALLTDQINRLTEERDRLAQGGEIITAEPEKVMEGYIDLVSLISQLPADFKRFEDTLEGMRRDLIAEFRADTRPRGQAVDSYVKKARNVMTATSEGRAVNGALQLLKSELLLGELRRDLDTILAHEFTGALTHTEIVEMRTTISSLRTSVSAVLSHRHRISSAMADYVPHVDALEDRELDRVLRNLQQQLVTWVGATSNRAKVDIELLQPRAAIGHTRERLFNPSDHVPPAPLLDVSEDAPTLISAEELRQQGGPTLAALRDALMASIETNGTVTTTTLFATLPTNMRRPVEGLGLLAVAGGATGDDHTDETGVLEAIRTDGTRRNFRVPQITLTAAHLAALRAETDTPEDRDTDD